MTTLFICLALAAFGLKVFYMVSFRLAAINHLLEEEGLWGRVKMHVFQWEPIQLDIGLISLELPSLFPQLFVDGDQTLLPAVAKSLWSLQMLLGRAHVTLTLGKYAKQVQSMTEVILQLIISLRNINGMTFNIHYYCNLFCRY